MRNRERNRLAVMVLVAATTLATPLAAARVDAPASSRAGHAPDYREVTIPRAPRSASTCAPAWGPTPAGSNSA